MSRIAVTGASGFVGRATLAALAGAGHETVAVTRGAPVPGATRSERVEGLHDVAGLRRAFAGARGVVHLAARVHVMRETIVDPLRAFRDANVEGTRAVLDAATAEGVERLVYMSTVKVHGEGRESPYTEDDEPQPADAYARSKLEAEQLLQARADGPTWTIIRPPLVYGPGVRANFARLARLAALARRWPVPLGGLRNRRSLVFVRNLADATLRALAAAAAQRTFLVSDGEDLSTSDLLRRLARAQGGEARLLPCPVPLLRLAGRLTGRVTAVERLTGSLCVDASRIRHELGWSPPFTVDQGLAETVAAP